MHYSLQHAVYLEGMAELRYSITLEGVDTKAENLILDLPKSNKKSSTKESERIRISLLHMHEHGVIHSNFGIHNIVKFCTRWKLLRLRASVSISEKTNPNRGFYYCPESMFV